MRIAPIDAIKPSGSITKLGKIGGAGQAEGSSDAIGEFKDYIKGAISEVNKLQHQGDEMAVKMATGEVEDVHEAMIAMQKAKLSLDFTIQVRNKVVEAYQEIMRMQV